MSSGKRVFVRLSIGNVNVNVEGIGMTEVNWFKGYEEIPGKLVGNERSSMRVR